MYLLKLPTFRLLKTTLFMCCIVAFVLFNGEKVEAGSVSWYLPGSSIPRAYTDCPGYMTFGSMIVKYYYPSYPWQDLGYNTYTCTDVDIKFADFNADTDKAQYAPGETIALHGCASMTPGGDNSAAGLSSSMGDICGASSWCCGTIYPKASMSPGVHNISLTGCYITGSNCANSSLSYTVVTPQVNIYFSFWEKIKDALENIFEEIKVRV